MKSHLKAKNNGLRERQAKSGYMVSLLTVALTITILWLTANLIFDHKPAHEKIYNRYFEPFANVLKSAETPDQGNYPEAMKLYESGNYGEAILKFEEAVINDPDNQALQFYCAISQLEVGNVDFAIADFQDVIKSNHPTFSSPSSWYLGLAYLRSGQIAKAEAVFKSIKSSDLLYKDQAVEVLDRM